MQSSVYRMEACRDVVEGASARYVDRLIKAYRVERIRAPNLADCRTNKEPPGTSPGALVMRRVQSTG
jgi:hypothetical protein